MRWVRCGMGEYRLGEGGRKVRKVEAMAMAVVVVVVVCGKLKVP